MSTSLGFRQRSRVSDTPYDALLAGGRLIDPAQGVDKVLDVGFRDGRVAAVAPTLSRQGVERIVDCGGCVVAPGMIDIHVHVFDGIGPLGIPADPHCVAKGVTSAVDAGTAGADTFPGFRKYVIEASATRLFAFVNISGIGMATEVGELQDLRHASVPRAVETVEANRDVVLGIKVRLTRDLIVSEQAGLRPLFLARDAADAAGVPIMVHPQGAWAGSIDDVLAVMRSGDIVTHCYHGADCGILDENGRVRRSVREAFERGVIFDLGHGAGSFSWHIAEAALAQEFEPGTISSDLHAGSVDGPVFDLATTASKLLRLGLPLDRVLAKVTATPAAALGMAAELGTLAVGSWGDAVVFEVRRGRFRFLDAEAHAREGAKLLVPVAVVRAGRVYREEVR